MLDKDRQTLNEWVTKMNTTLLILEQAIESSKKTVQNKQVISRFESYDTFISDNRERLSLLSQAIESGSEDQIVTLSKRVSASAALLESDIQDLKAELQGNKQTIRDEDIN